MMPLEYFLRKPCVFKLLLCLCKLLSDLLVEIFYFNSFGLCLTGLCLPVNSRVLKNLSYLLCCLLKPLLGFWSS